MTCVPQHSLDLDRRQSTEALTSLLKVLDVWRSMGGVELCGLIPWCEQPCVWTVRTCCSHHDGAWLQERLSYYLIRRESWASSMSIRGYEHDVVAFKASDAVCKRRHRHRKDFPGVKKPATSIRPLQLCLIRSRRKPGDRHTEFPHTETFSFRIDVLPWTACYQGPHDFESRNWGARVLG